MCKCSKAKSVGCVKALLFFVPDCVQWLVWVAFFSQNMGLRNSLSRMGEWKAMRQSFLTLYSTLILWIRFKGWKQQYIYIPLKHIIRFAIFFQDLGVKMIIVMNHDINIFYKHRYAKSCLMAHAGLEPATFALLARRSNQLS